MVAFDDTAALVVFGILLYVVVKNRHQPIKHEIESEVDMTRYRHNGIQSLVWDRGNGAPAQDWTVLQILNELS